MNVIYVFIPIISGLIGWFTNFLVIKFLFWPREPYIIPLFNFRIQGVFSRRKPDIAKAVSEVVSEDLMSKKKMIESIDKEKVSNNLMNFTERKMDEVIDKRLSGILPGTLKKRISSIIKSALKEDLNETVDEGMDRLLNDGVDQIDIKNMIENEINSLNVEEVERITFKVAKKEFKFIEVFGGILGLIIGLVQVAILTFV